MITDLEAARRETCAVVMKEGATTERAKIVEWLRYEETRKSFPEYLVYHVIADAIERGEHGDKS